MDLIKEDGFGVPSISSKRLFGVPSMDLPDLRLLEYMDGVKPI